MYASPLASSPPGVNLINNFFTYNWNLNPNSCYTFVLTNDEGNGICCNLGNGYYNIRSTADSSNSFLFGGQFIPFSESKSFHTPLNAGINETNSFANIQVFPNPTTGKITIHSKGDAILNYKVYNFLGEEVQVKISGNELAD